MTDKMELMFIVYSNAIDDEITSIIKMHSSGYTRFSGIEGEGSGEPHLGSHIWPGVNNCIMTAADKAVCKKIKAELGIIKEKFRGVGIHAFILPLNEMS